ncbi:bifunctional aconitate hydratase 2/2-methylisocitrate dehydratase [Rickettsiella endosymbiont of Dermanyssus gallinae]|uniref:bifunctional aconitate hydratase 2/2-methylisocitrate dehydratase n=1 Tax=Rickettsiella endosymbiont of Dermanyssus gallinae TaxID=2856608 RepID=UPI001FE2BE2C|nr:bifunctional aconitate hydratase 2/2-methylisocitrate dehydratase [Rickettsiella endosymbiont of Dermanyssus gallinae]
MSSTTQFLKAYEQHVQLRASEGIGPLPLSAEQVAELVELLKSPPQDVQGPFLVELLSQRIAPGVDPAAYVKAAFLAALAKGETKSPFIDPIQAVELLGTMLGGYNVPILIELLDHPSLADTAAKQLSHTLLMFDACYDVIEKANTGNLFAKPVIEAWANAAWFTSKPEVPHKLTVSVFKVSGEINTDDLSPATEAWSRPDIPLHSLEMLRNRMPEGLEIISGLKSKGYPIAFVGDVVGTGSSRKSAINSVLWHMGEPIPFVPNKHRGGIILGGTIAPIFRTTAEDSGAFPIEVDVSELNTGDVIHIYPYEGRITDEQGLEIARFEVNPPLLDAVRAGGRIPLIIGRSLTDKVCEAMGLSFSNAFYRPKIAQESAKGFTLAQKMVGKACGLAGIRPGTYCEPKISAVGSQDTTGPMTRDELKELACLGFSADLVMQSFCHTAAYPKPVDIETQHSLPDFFSSRGGIVLRPGDGIIHSWLNRMLLPDTVGTGGDSHTRFPIGISFPGGSGVVAFAAAMGVMPLTMPESVLVRFTGQIQPGITLRDLVNAIPYVALQRGLLTLASKNKENIFSGRILEIEGLPDLKIEQAFEFADASAERSANGCTVRLNKEPVIEYLNSNISLLKWMITNGYQDVRSLQRRIDAMQHWLLNPVLLEPDTDAEYAEVIDIDLNQITEPLLACPNDPDNIKPLSEVAKTKVDEVFIGSCMTNIGHYRAAGSLLKNVTGHLPSILWIAPPTKMDAHQLMQEGYYAIYGSVGARTEMPGCSLCMGNQARVQNGATVVSTSTRNFPNRMGKGANVYLASAELSAITATLGYLPSTEEYKEKIQFINTMADDLYRYLNFDQMADYQTVSKEVSVLADK